MRDWTLVGNGLRLLNNHLRLVPGYFGTASRFPPLLYISGSWVAVAGLLVLFVHAASLPCRYRYVWSAVHMSPPTARQSAHAALTSAWEPDAAGL